MPSLSFSQAKNLFYKYISSVGASDPVVSDAINYVNERFISSGQWKGNRFIKSFSCSQASDGTYYFDTVPGVESVLRAVALNPDGATADQADVLEDWFPFSDASLGWLPANYVGDTQILRLGSTPSTSTTLNTEYKITPNCDKSADLYGKSFNLNGIVSVYSGSSSSTITFPNNTLSTHTGTVPTWVISAGANVAYSITVSSVGPSGTKTYTHPFSINTQLSSVASWLTLASPTGAGSLISSAQVVGSNIYVTGVQDWFGTPSNNTGSYQQTTITVTSSALNIIQTHSDPSYYYGILTGDPNGNHCASVTVLSNGSYYVATLGQDFTPSLGATANDVANQYGQYIKANGYSNQYDISGASITLTQAQVISISSDWATIPYSQTLGIIPINVGNSEPEKVANSIKTYASGLGYECAIEGSTVTITSEKSGFYINDINFGADIQKITADSYSVLAPTQRYRLLGSVPETRQIYCLVRRGYVPLVNDNDMLFPSNRNAYRYGVQAYNYENINELERAELYWQLAYKCLNDEAEAFEDGVQTQIDIQTKAFAPHAIQNLI